MFGLTESMEKVASGCCTCQQDNKLTSLYRIKSDYSPVQLTGKANLKSLAGVT